MENLWLIVGLGNPGAEYSRTRHNAGFILVDQLGLNWRVSWGSEKKFQARLARADVGGRRVILCEPQTYMNLSGESVAAVMSFYRLEAPRLLVVVDDADLPLGGLRLKPGGGSGGHHGLESIERNLGYKDFARMRIGIGRRDGARQITDHVLGRFSSTETVLLDKILAVASRQAEAWIEAGIQKAMNQFNGMLETPDPENEGKAQ
ncbi:MAG: aminoacyl-tRNA hydrolase [Verrucomicrobiota bacterium]|jgi:PTH1 family peptidyl-tRNA hydrolase|nr:aminoacyl-tRNA hydrolase [Verrucomicrobiota bacterium]